MLAPSGPCRWTRTVSSASVGLTAISQTEDLRGVFLVK